MEKVERQIKTFKCEFSNQDFKGLPKKTERLVSNKDSSLLGLGMQVVLQGGETNRHAHTGQDAAWLVLEGRARFYGKTDDEVFELNPMEGLFRGGQVFIFDSSPDLEYGRGLWHGPYASNTTARYTTSHLAEMIAKRSSRTIVTENCC
jgi:hypothetical protein